ncbi:methyltransferase domain-containing protein [Halalkalicoccus subterraneus]|uniref:methyltransferase domain-containing protein n=1 Tax=Halalkalicoccus subterraneus TaxID=2675002 RepID=UPI000EFBA1CA|nr:methyltransferase domain-containing protein [Halalkalicoccus subterraneus]
MNDFQEYLHAKRTVDDRALNRRVLARLRVELPDAPRTVEAGAGIGTGITRLLDWGVLPEGVEYTAIDNRSENAAVAREHLLDAGFSQEDDRLVRDDTTVSLVAGDAFEVLSDGEYDLLVAQAFLDLVELDDALPALFEALSPGGLAYFPITFDGETVFEPAHPLDDRVLGAYHRDMDREGSSETGRKLLAAVPKAGGELLAAGSSDWVVYPPYSGDERVFLDHILDTVEGALADELGEGLQEWLAARRRQLRDDELVYIAHQLDVLARV